MKKTITLMAVLFLAAAPFASAVVESSAQTYYYAMDVSASGSSFETGDTITIEIFAGDTVAVSDMLSTVLNISTAASIGSVTQGTAGSWGSFNASTSADGTGGYNVNVDGTIAAGGIATGSLVYSVSFVAGAAGTVTIDAVSGTWSGWDAAVGAADGFNDGVTPGYEAYGLPYAEITVIPEPMTMGLLGLGGFFLRRRKK